MKLYEIVQRIHDVAESLEAGEITAEHAASFLKQTIKRIARDECKSTTLGRIFNNEALPDTEALIHSLRLKI